MAVADVDASRPKLIRTPDGRIHRFPAEATPAQISAALSGKPAAPPPAMLPAHARSRAPYTGTPDEPLEEPGANLVGQAKAGFVEQVVPSAAGLSEGVVGGVRRTIAAIRSVGEAARAKGFEAPRPLPPEPEPVAPRNLTPDVPEPRTIAEKVARGLGGVVGYAGEAALLTPFVGPQAALVIPSVTGAGTIEQRAIRAATMIGAGPVLGKAAELTAGAPAAVRAVAGVAAPAVVYGSAVPFADVAGQKLIGIKGVEWPTAADAIPSVATLALFGGFLHATGLAGKKAPPQINGLSREKAAAFLAITEHLKEPGFRPGTSQVAVTELRKVGHEASAELSKSLKGTISLEIEGKPVSVRVAVARVYPYPGEARQVRLVVEDVATGQRIPLSFADIGELNRSIQGPALAPGSTEAVAGIETPVSATEPAAATVAVAEPTVEAAPPRAAPEPEPATRGRAPAVPEGRGKGAAPAFVRGDRVMGPNLETGFVVGTTGETVRVMLDTGEAKVFAPDKVRGLPGAARATEAELIERGAEAVEGGAAQPRGAEISGEPPKPAGAPEAEVTRAGTRSYQPGERLTVPYTGPGKKATREYGEVIGYRDINGVPHVVVKVRRGKSVETHAFTESQVRRRPKIDRRPAGVRNERLREAISQEAGGDIERAYEMTAKARDLFVDAEQAAKALQGGDVAAYRRATVRMRKLRDAFEVSQSVLTELGGAHIEIYGPHVPFEETAIGQGAAAFAPTRTMQQEERQVVSAVMGQGGFVVPGEFLAAMGRAIKRLTSIGRREVEQRHQAIMRVETTPPTAADRIIKALRAARPVREKQEAAYSAERARRIEQSTTMERGKAGEERLRARLASQKGELPKVKFESIAGAVTQKDVDELVDTILNHPALRYYEKNRAGIALQKLLGESGGEVPQRNELELLEVVFGPEFVKEVLAKRGEIVGARAAGYMVLNTARTLRTSFDLSAPLRQGLFLAPSFPKEWGRAWLDMHRFYASELDFTEAQKELWLRPNSQLYRSADLAITRRGSALLEKQEEAFLGAEFAEQIPGVRASERGYIGFLNQLRADVFDALVVLAKKNGLDPAKDPVMARKIAGFVNAATGRGDSKFISDHAQGLNAIFFAPRLIKSRLHLLNPKHYIFEPAFIRRQYLKSGLAFAGAASLVLTLAGWAGAEVEKRRLNADWGKIRVGGVVYDILGGLSQYLRFYPELAQTLTAQLQGKKVKASAVDLLARFGEHKLSPIADFTLNWLRGWKMAEGGKKKLTAADLPAEILNVFVPMIGEDFFNVMKQDPRQLPMAMPASVYGVSVQTYKKPVPKPSAPPAPPRPRRP